MSDKNYFSCSDGWLFATLKTMNKEILRLDSILSVGNTLNHAIFTLEQINVGLSRLESEGFVELIGNRIFLTKKAKIFIKKNHKRFELCIDEQVRFSQIFSEMELLNNTEYKEYFSQSEYDFAMKKYTY